MKKRTREQIFEEALARRLKQDEDDQQAMREFVDEEPVKKLASSHDSNDTRSLMVELLPRPFPDDHRDVDHLIEQLIEEANDPAPMEMDEDAPPAVPAPARPARGFQRELDIFDGEVDTDDDEEDNGAIAPMQMDAEDTNGNLLDAAKYRVGPEWVPPGAAAPGYARPDAPAIDPQEQDFIFMHIESSYAIDERTLCPVVRVWGITEHGNSVLLEDDAFQPYFYAHIRDDAVDAIRSRLNAHLRQTYGPKQKSGRVHNGQFVVSMERTFGRSLCGYVPATEPMQVLYKITMAHPAHVAAARNSLEYANRAVASEPIATFEGNVPYELRWLIDKRINGCQWVRLRAGTYTRTDPHASHSTAQYELRCASAEPVDMAEKGTIAPVRVLSCDIEVEKRGRGFPTAETDPAIMISNALHVVGTGGGNVHRVVFATRPALDKNYHPLGAGGVGEDDDSAELYVYNSERAMLLAWRQYVVACDPDCFTGWNIDGFDMPYLAGRAKALGIYDEFMGFTRIRGKSVWMRKATTQSKAMGARESTEMLCEGRFSFDAMMYTLKMVMDKFRSYTLNYVSKKLLGEQKIDVDHTFIPTLYNSDDDQDRTHLARYCMRDSLLPLRLLDKLMAVINCIEQARVTGVPIKWILSRGQGIKTFSNILRYKAEWQHTPSRSPKTNSVVTAGGHVEEPLRGYYKTPIVSLDFSSLYPSAMIAANLCYSTKVPLAWARAHLNPDDYVIPYPSVDKKTADELEREKRSKRKKNKREREREAAEEAEAGKEPDFCFVKRSVQHGVLPRMLEQLLATRAAVKNLMKSPEAKADEMVYFVYDGRQLAIKVCANSVYGFLKAFIITDKDLMAAVTSYGRNMLRIVKATIKEHFSNVRVVDVPKCRLLGLDPELEPDTAEGSVDPRPYTTATAVIVYGDTDSTMVSLGDVTLSDCAKYGAQMAAMCTAQFEKPNALVFEAVKLRALYINKKRYAALQIEKYIKGERMESALARAQVVIKGLEGKRRDNAPIGSELQVSLAETILLRDDIASAEQQVRDTLQALLENRVDMSQLVISKGLSKTEEQYATSGAKQQHVELQRRIRKRSRYTGELVPETGERVDYIMLSGPAKKKGKGSSLASDLSENPLYAQRTGAPVDVDWYIQKQLWPGVARVMTCVYEPERCDEIEPDMSLADRSTFQVYQRLFAQSLPHMLHRVVPRAKNFGIAAYAKALPQCLGCGCRVGPQDAVCANCDTDTVLGDKFEELERRQAIHDDVWDVCNQCQRGRTKNIQACRAVSCNNFFRRDRVLMDLEDIGKDLQRFF